MKSNQQRHRPAAWSSCVLNSSDAVHSMRFSPNVRYAHARALHRSGKLPGGTGSLSMIYLANTLREVFEAVHLLLGASSGVDHDEGSPGAAVVEFMPPKFGLRRTLRVRLATPNDDAIAPY